MSRITGLVQITCINLKNAFISRLHGVISGCNRLKASIFYLTKHILLSSLTVGI